MNLLRNQIICGDCLETMRSWPDAFINCCVTSPPYWGLRDYGCDGQLGLESTPEEFIAKMVEMFAEVKRVLRDDGTLWLNLGDSYSGSIGKRNGSQSSTLKGGLGGCAADLAVNHTGLHKEFPNLKPKDLCGIPWRVALALQADGWYLRQDIIWHKPNPMPESVTDRCTKTHEYIFLLTKKAKYYYDKDAIAEPCVESNASRPRMGQGGNTQYNQKRGDAKHRQTDPQASGHRMIDNTQKAMDARGAHDNPFGETRNKRSVWTVPTKAYSDAHFATFPPGLITPCILAGCPKEVCVKCGEPRVRITKIEGEWKEGHNRTQKHDGTIYRKNPGGGVKGPNTTTSWTDCGCNEGFKPGITLDPFMGSGTVAEVAIKNGRDYLGCELNPEYMELNGQRTQSAETGIPVKELKAGQKALFTT